MEIIKEDDKVIISKYAFNKNLIDKDIWKWAKQYAKNVKKTNRMSRNLFTSKRTLHGVKY